MKSSLEDERRTLLEQIEASRAVYRRMLAGETIAGSRPWVRHAADLHAELPAERSRRNRALQWVYAHPLQVAAAVALLVLLAPRIAGSSRTTARRKEARQQERALPSGGTLRALLTVAALLLRDPARLRAATAILGNVWRWLSRRKAAPVMFTRTTTTASTTAAAPSTHAGTRLH